jgi:hypothetical protein
MSELGFLGGPRMMIGLTGKPCKAFIIYIDTEGLKAGHEDVDSQVKFQSIEQERVVDVPADNQLLVNWDLLDILHQENAFSLGRVLWLDYPEVVLRKALVFMILSIEVREFNRQNVSLRDYVECFTTVNLLHLYYIEA